MTIDQLRQQRAAGFRRLRFQPQLEAHYQKTRDRGIRERARPVCASGLALFLLYALLDWMMLPTSVAQDTIAIRLLITCPTIALTWWLSWRPISDAAFTRIYALAYLIGGLSVISIIGVARLAEYPIPYEGILLMLMFGYFVMGIPFRTVSILSFVMVTTFLAVEYTTGMPSRDLLINGFFIFTANIIGMVGSWLSEHRQRAHFLDQQMLAALRQQAETESERKTSLITIAGHDLRQPLNIISLILENLTVDGLPDEQAGLVERLRTSVTHFNGLLASVLDISRLQEGMVKPEPDQLSPNRVMAQLDETCRERAQSLGVELHFQSMPEDHRVIADPQLLHRVLQNLIFNALDHSGGSCIEVGASFDARRVRITVADNGRGIDANTRSRMFDPFFRVSDASDPGLGLGLAIVKELTELMGGSCHLEPGIGPGACFVVSLPAQRHMANSADKLEAVSSPVAPHQGLIVVEDHEESRQWVQRTLQGWGYRVQSFANAEQAMAESKNLANAILVTDLHLPKLPGDRLFSVLTQKQLINGGVLVTADTSRAEGYDPSQRLWTLHKPLQPMRLRAAIQQLTRHS